MTSTGTSDAKSASIPLRVGFRTNTLSDERLRYVRQLGVADVFVNPVEPSGGTGGDDFADESDRTESDRQLPLGPDHVPSVEYLRELTDACEERGIRLAGIHTLGYRVYGDVKFDREGSAEQLAAIERLIRNVGEAGIPILGYQWNPRGVVPMRTGTAALRSSARGPSSGCLTRTRPESRRSTASTPRRGCGRTTSGSSSGSSPSRRRPA